MQNSGNQGARWSAVLACLASLSCWGNPERRLANKYALQAADSGDGGTDGGGQSSDPKTCEHGISIGSKKCDPDDPDNEYECTNPAGSDQWKANPCKPNMQCIGRSCQPVDSCGDPCQQCMLARPRADIIGYPIDFGSTCEQRTATIADWCTFQIPPQEYIVDGTVVVCDNQFTFKNADCIYTKAVDCAHWCTAEMCGSACTRCVLAHLACNNLLRTWGHDMSTSSLTLSCQTVDLYVDNWRQGDRCDFCQTGGACYDVCKG